jgi:hypothetical protein
MLTDTLVSNPVKTNVIPNAKTIGQAVGAGSCKVPGVICRVSTGDSKAVPFFSAR